MRPIPEPLAGLYRAQGYWHDEDLWTGFETAALASPEKIALICGDRAVRFSDLREDTARLGAAMASRGIGPGDIVVIHGRNGIDSTLAMLAAAWCGAVFAPLPPMFSEAQIAAVAASAGAKAVFCLGNENEQARATAAAAGLGSLCVLVARSGQGSAIPFDRLLDEGAIGSRRAVSSRDLAMLVYSSGTTGAPKGVMHAADTIRYAVEQRARMHGVDSGDRCLIACQFGFVGGVVFGTLSGLLLGNTSVALPSWDADAALATIEEQRITYGLFMPTHVHDLLHAPSLDRADLSSLRHAAMGGLSPSQREAAIAKLTPLPFPGYGMSECLGNTTCSPTDPVEKRLTREGRPYPGTEIRVVDEDDRPCAPGQPGAILLRGPSRCLGYYRSEELTEAAFTQDGFFRTGDIGTLDVDGYLSFAGRQKDIIRRGSVTIVPGEVEAVLAQHPAIRHVAVVGMPDERFGEIACACVIPDGEAPDLASLTAFLAERRVARYQWPEQVAVFDEFPRTPSLKVQKPALAKALGERIKRGMA